VTCLGTAGHDFEEVVSRIVRSEAVRRALILLALLGAGCRGSSPRPVAERVSDVTITSAVRAHLAGDAHLTGLDLGVATYRGVVTLTGRVQRESQRERAARLAGQVEGVRGVRNLIRVGDRGAQAPRSDV
jgi:osmotically-inducible protein OsmY